MKLNVKITLIIGAAVLISSAGIGLMTLQISSGNLETTILNAIGENTASNAELLSATLNGQLDVLWEIANRARTRTLDWSVIQPSLLPDIPRIGADSMALILPDGASYDIETGTYIDLSDRDYFQRAMKGEKTIEVMYSRLQKRIMVLFAAPIFRDDADGAPVIGVLLAAKDGGHTISDMVVNLKSIMPSGYSYLVDNAGVSIAHPNTDLVTSEFNPIAEAETYPSYKSMADMVKTALVQRNGISRYTFEGRNLIGRYVEVPGFPWLLFSSIERTDIDDQIARLRLLLLVTSLGASLALTVGLAFVGSRSVLVSVEEKERITREAVERKAEIEKLMNALKQASENRTAFLANISGSMANPINNIIRISSLLSKYTEITDDYQKNMEAINDEGMKLFDIINDILDILKIESGKLKLAPVKYKLPKLISDITSDYLVHAEDKPVQYILIADEKLPLNLYGDDLRIKQICHHLITNAFKFTEKGSITVKITHRAKNGYALLFIRIMDTGSGIPENKLQNIFVNYGQGSGGLGLFICKQLAEMMKGTLAVSSELGRGSVFTLCVPQKMLSGETIGPETAAKLTAFKS